MLIYHLQIVVIVLLAFFSVNIAIITFHSLIRNNFFQFYMLFLVFFIFFRLNSDSRPRIFRLIQRNFIPFVPVFFLVAWNGFIKCENTKKMSKILMNDRLSYFSRSRSSLVVFYKTTQVDQKYTGTSSMQLFYGVCNETLSDLWDHHATFVVCYDVFRRKVARFDRICFREIKLLWRSLNLTMVFKIFSRSSSVCGCRSMNLSHKYRTQTSLQLTPNETVKGVGKTKETPPKNNMVIL